MSSEELVAAILAAPRGKSISVDEILKEFDVERKLAVEALKKLGDEGKGRYIVGRGSFPTRLEWGRGQTIGDKGEPPPLIGRQTVPVDNTAYVEYTCPLDNNRDAKLRLPRDLSQEEADLISRFVKALERKKMES